ncbi:MAG: group III truncated hemoglobin [Sphingomonas sp.]
MGRHTAITEPAIRELVDTFYARVRQDAFIGPVFNDAIDDWPAHLDKLAAFWSSVMLTSGRYKGRPVPAHAKHGARIAPEMFNRWLAIWRATTAELFAADLAAGFQEKADRIAESLSLALFFTLGPAKTETLPA